MRNFMKHIVYRAVRETKKLSPNIFLTSIISSIVASTFPFASIYFLSIIIDNLINNENSLVFIIIYALIILVLFFLKESLSNINKYKFDILYGNELNSISNHILEKSYSTLNEHRYRKIVSRHQESINQNGGPLTMLTAVLSSTVSSLVTISLSVIFVFPFFSSLFQEKKSYLNNKYVIISSIILMSSGGIISFITSLLINKKKHKKQNELYQLNNIVNYYSNLLIDYNSGKEVRIFNEKKVIKEHLSQVIDCQIIKLNKKISWYDFISSTISSLIGGILGIIIYFFIGVSGILGLTSIALTIRFMGSFLQLAKSISSVGNTVGSFTNIIPSLHYYFDVIDEGENTEYGMDKVQYEFNQISFQKVYFKYENSKDFSIKNLSLNINKGEKIAIVGENGSGKTTLIKLLCRLYKPTSGIITINNKNIENYDQNYENFFSVVFQDFSIFSLPIGQTIASAIKYDKEIIEHCINEVKLSYLINQLPKKYESYFYKDCDKFGIEISGGEAQRFALARALYKNAPIMILDEPTASLDPYTEYELYKKFDEITSGKTVIYISHRLSSCRFCDRIIVLDKGTIVQNGSHEELLRNRTGKYYKLWTSQARNYIE